MAKRRGRSKGGGKGLGGGMAMGVVAFILGAGIMYVGKDKIQSLLNRGSGATAARARYMAALARSRGYY
jgi:hypothetical protein